MKTISQQTFQRIADPDFARYAERYIEIEKNTLRAIEQYGLAFDTAAEYRQESRKLQRQLRDKGAVFANSGKSIHINWISDACVACRTGEESYTAFLSLKCHRNCYFCFNQNQQDYEYYQHHLRQAAREVRQMSQQGAPLRYAALTGGEPLLHKQAATDFFAQLHDEFPAVHSRLYTAGDPLDRDTARKLQQSGLKEIRFSIKIDDPPEKQARIMRRIRLARDFIPTVMVEMPVIPGTLAQMRQLLRELDDIGVDGINLLEFCFPLSNAETFRHLGFELKYPPYQVYYNYWYAGGLAIANSENTALALMLFALDNGLKLGVHYCSLENKHTGQIYQQNHGRPVDDSYYFSPHDYFFKCAKVFGRAIDAVTAILAAHRQPVKRIAQYNCIQFHPSAIALLGELDIEVCLSLNVVERHSAAENYIKEVQLQHVTPSMFALSAI
ncbi:radical SAM protein [Brenneria corticis]|uniref:Radical SAM protein n=1 Tax=Brenneria corticis TaxID=2173106 RepID=A0A2U1TS02_9GAMM|nr:radical SAM protein [Brenneria sp. CFCC 11842]PWC12190.1 radical SAM protein [Brenneria sp. CFCC 11842]